MNSRKPTIPNSLLLVCLNVCLIAGGVELARGESSFTSIVPFGQQDFTVTLGMTAIDPRTLIINFGEPNEFKSVTLPEVQDFDFALLDAPVDHPDTAESQPVPVNESSGEPNQQPNAIPEPSSLVLLGFGIVLLIRRIWRKNARM